MDVDFKIIKADEKVKNKTKDQINDKQQLYREVYKCRKQSEKLATRFIWLQPVTRKLNGCHFVMKTVIMPDQLEHWKLGRDVKGSESASCGSVGIAAATII